jgi:two-component system cell cycle response regulator
MGKSMPTIEIDHSKKSSHLVLIVDDSSTNIELLRAILEGEGYRIAVATNGKQAIKIATSLTPDLILLDVMMPEMNGFEACAKLQTIPETQEIPIVFITAKTEVDDIVKGFNNGGVDYITKPFRHEEVCARVRTHCNIHVMREREKLQTINIRNILYSISDGIITTDDEAIVTFINPATEKLLGINAIDYTGQTLEKLLQLSPTDFNSLLQGDTRQEINRFDDEGRGTSLELNITVLNSTPTQYICILHNIAHHKARETELTNISNTDPLTGVANRRYFDDRLQYEWQNAQKQNSPLSLLMIDIDFFKQYNDHYGHLEGDQCLKRIAQALSDGSRRSADLAARYGGEEFVVILAQGDLTRATKHANYLCEKIRSMNIPHAKSVEGKVSVSVGLAHIQPTVELNEKTLIQQADTALYQAKSNGRNRVEHFRENTET